MSRQDPKKAPNAEEQNPPSTPTNEQAENSQGTTETVSTITIPRPYAPEGMGG